MRHIIFFFVLLLRPAFSQDSLTTAWEDIPVVYDMGALSTEQDFAGAVRIDLSDQNLAEVPPAVYNCRNLRELVMNNNTLTALDARLAELKSLEVLSLKMSFTDFRQAHWDVILALPKLQKLTLDYCGVTFVPDEIENLSDLRHFSLGQQVRPDAGGNSISELPSGICKLQALRFLYLNGIELKELPGCFDNLQLSELNISQNRLSDRDLDVIDDMKFLYYDISGNGFSDERLEKFIEGHPLEE